MIMKTRNLETAEKVARLHLVRAVAEAVLGSSYAPRMGVPTFVPAGLGSTLRLKPAAAGDAELAARVQRYDLLDAACPAAVRARADLRARSGSTPVSKAEAAQNAAWLLAQGRRDRDPGAHTYLVHVPALRIETTDGHVLEIPKQRVELLAHGQAYATVRGQAKMPVRLQDERWHWAERLADPVREAWASLAEQLCVTVPQGHAEPEAA